MHPRIRALLLLLSAHFSFWGQAQIPVRVERPAKLFSLPTERSLILTETGGRSNFRALEQSADRQWVFISDGLRYGWIRKIFISSVDEATAAVSDLGAPMTETRESVVATTAPDKDLPSEEDLEKEAPEGADDDIEDEAAADADEEDIYLVKIPGSFYEAPKKNSQRFGKLMPNDQIELLDTSPDSKWVNARLVETGEEGWIPRTRVGRKVPRAELKQLDSPSDRNTHIGAYGVLAPEPWNFGFIGTLRHGFQALTIGQTRLELGVGGGFNIGTIDSYQGADIDVTYLDMRVFAHYEPLLSARFSLPIELGLLYKYGVIETELSELQFEESESRVMQSEFGGYVGIGLSYFLFNSLRVEVLPQVQLTSSVDMVLNAGLVLSF